MKTMKMRETLDLEMMLLASLKPEQHGEVSLKQEQLEYHFHLWQVLLPE